MLLFKKNSRQLQLSRGLPEPRPRDGTHLDCDILSGHFGDGPRPVVRLSSTDVLRPICPAPVCPNVQTCLCDSWTTTAKQGRGMDSFGHLENCDNWFRLHRLGGAHFSKLNCLKFQTNSVFLCNFKNGPIRPLFRSFHYAMI